MVASGNNARSLASSAALASRFPAKVAWSHAKIRAVISADKSSAMKEGRWLSGYEIEQPILFQRRKLEGDILRVEIVHVRLDVLDYLRVFDILF